MACLFLVNPNAGVQRSLLPVKWGVLLVVACPSMSRRRPTLGSVHDSALAPRLRPPSLRCRYTSQVFLSPPRQVRSKVANSTLFHHLDSTWTMEPGPTPASCWLTFAVDFAFRSQLHGYVADMFFSEVVKQMTGAFEKRCEQLYGESSLLRAEQLRKQQHHHESAPRCGSGRPA